MWKTLKTTMSMLKFKHQQKEEKQKKGAIKKTKNGYKSHWKCTHRAGVKCCDKNVIWLKIQYGGASRNAVPFL